MGILTIAETNMEVQLMLGILAIAIVCMPLIHNISALVEEFTPEKWHQKIDRVFATFFYAAVIAGCGSMAYIYYILDGVSGILISN